MAETYARAIKKIGQNPTKMERVQQIFKWIASAKRPLLLAELAEAVAFDHFDKSWDSTKIPHTSRLIQNCGNLVVLDDDGTARFAHHTVQQFLIGLPSQDSVPDFHFDPGKADIEAGDICMTYLLFSDFETQITIQEPQRTGQLPTPHGVISSIILKSGIGNSTSSISNYWQYLLPWRVKQPTLTLELDLSRYAGLKRTPPPDVKSKYQLLSYAIENWLKHLSMIDEDDGPWNKFKYLATEKSTSFDIRPWGDPSASNRLPQGMFRWAIDAGHVGLLELLLQSSKINLQAYCRRLSDEDHSIVTHAALRGHVNMIKFLLDEKCIDLGDGSSLLQLARSGNDSAVRLLLEHKLCDDDVKSSAMRIAAAVWHPAVIRVLLDNGSVLDLQHGWGKMILEKAAEKRSADILTALLNKAANFEIAITELGMIWGKDTNVLLEFAELGMTKFFQQVLATGKIDPNLEDTKHRMTPLCWAVSRREMAIIQLLLETRNVDVNAKSFGRAPLSLAAAGGHEDIVQQLLETGQIDVDSKDFRGCTPLSWAAASGHQNIVRQLLRTGQTNVNSMDSLGRTPLSWAKESGHEDIVRQLLETGQLTEFNVKSMDSTGRTQHPWAAGRGRVHIVRSTINA